MSMRCAYTSYGPDSVDEYANHPARQILEHGLLANLNTDDPAISGIDLPHEFEVAAPRAGLSPALARQAQANALEMAFLPDYEKRALLEKKAVVVICTQYPR